MQYYHPLTHSLLHAVVEGYDGAIPKLVSSFNTVPFWQTSPGVSALPPSDVGIL